MPTRARRGANQLAPPPPFVSSPKVAVEGLRPRFPPFAPAEFRALAEACWAADAAKR
jgi:hypothetical protein